MKRVGLLLGIELKSNQQIAQYESDSPERQKTRVLCALCIQRDNQTEIEPQSGADKLWGDELMMSS